MFLFILHPSSFILPNQLAMLFVKRDMIAIVLTIFLATSALAEDQLGSYIYSRGDHENTVRIMNHDWPVGMNMNESFFWFAYGGQTYIVRDAQTLQRIDALFAPVRALSPQRRELRARLRPLERRERDLERQSRNWERRLDRIEDVEGREADRREFQSKIHDLETQIHDVEVELQKLEPQEEALDKQEDQIEREAEKQLEPIAREAIRSGVASPKS